MTLGQTRERARAKGAPIRAGVFPLGLQVISPTRHAALGLDPRARQGVRIVGIERMARDPRGKPEGSPECGINRVQAPNVNTAPSRGRVTSGLSILSANLE